MTFFYKNHVTNWVKNLDLNINRHHVPQLNYGIKYKYLLLSYLMRDNKTGLCVIQPAQAQVKKQNKETTQSSLWLPYVIGTKLNKLILKKHMQMMCSAGIQTQGS